MIDKENGGYGVGCNLGISEATGTWISIVEPDDWLDPHMYEDMLAFAGTFEERLDVHQDALVELRGLAGAQEAKCRVCKLRRRIKTSKRPLPSRSTTLLIEIHPGIWSALYRKGFLDEHPDPFPRVPPARVGPITPSW